MYRSAFANSGGGSGWAQNKFAIARFNQTGDSDLGFGCPIPGPTCTGQPGAKFTDFTGANETANGLIQERISRKPVAAGYATDSGGNRQFAVARYTATDGSEDTTFGRGTGKVVTTFPGYTSSCATSLVEDFSYPQNVHLVAVGTAWPSACCNDARIALARYDGAGNMDTSFGLYGRVITNIPTTSSEFATSVAVDTNAGKVRIAGGADGKMMVARYSNDGLLDTNFGCDPANRPCNGWNVDDLPKVTDELAYDLVLAGSSLFVAGKAETRQAGTSCWRSTTPMDCGILILDARPRPAAASSLPTSMSPMSGRQFRRRGPVPCHTGTQNCGSRLRQSGSGNPTVRISGVHGQRRSGPDIRMSRSHHVLRQSGHRLP